MSKAEHKCTIGEWIDYDNTRLMTLDELKEEIENNNSSIDYWEKENPEVLKCFSARKLHINDFCDKRKNTNLYRFDYCPYCGEKINWKDFKGMV